MPGRKRKQAKSTNGSSSIIISDNAYGTSITTDGIDDNNGSGKDDDPAVSQAQLFIVSDTP